MNSKVSIYDIANYLGISAATVSYVINGVDKVSPKTKERVLKAIEELQYVPNYTARALSTGKSHLIGLLLPLEDASIAFLQNPFYSEFIGGLEKGLQGYNYDLVIGASKSVENFKEWIQSRDLDALIVIGFHSDKMRLELNDIKIPTVLIDDHSKNLEGFNTVKSDDYKGTYLATKYLIECNHKNIGFVGSPTNYLIDKIRYDGYTQAMQEAGLEVLEDNIIDCDATYQAGYDVAFQIMANKEITALVTTGDMLAIGIMNHLLEKGYKIPGDISIVGYDDILNSQVAFPPLTTIHQHITKKGVSAAKGIIKFLEEDKKEPFDLVLTPYLVERKSVRKL